MQWFRWYTGTIEDGKFRTVARNGRVTLRDVIAVWALLLEEASHPDHRGVCTKMEDYIAAVLDFEDGVAEAILSAMEGQRLISVGHGAITITNWKKRQFETDAKDPTNAERQRRFRDKQKSTTDETPRNGDVTAETRPDTDSESETETEAEAETETGKTNGGAPAPPNGLAFCGQVVRLKQADFDKWRRAYADIPDLMAEIQAADDYYAENPPKSGKWYFPLSSWLKRENAKLAAERTEGARGDDWW